MLHHCRWGQHRIPAPHPQEPPGTRGGGHPHTNKAMGCLSCTCCASTHPVIACLEARLRSPSRGHTLCDLPQGGLVTRPAASDRQPRDGHKTPRPTELSSGCSCFLLSAQCDCSKCYCGVHGQGPIPGLTQWLSQAMAYRYRGRGGGGGAAWAPPPDPPPCVTFRRVVVPLRGPGQSPVLPFACCVGSMRSVGRCGRCSCWCRFRVRGAQ